MGSPFSLLFFAQIWFLCNISSSSPSPSLSSDSPVILFHANNSSAKSFHLKEDYSAPPASRQLAGLSSEVEVSTFAGTSGSAGSTNGVGTSSQFNGPFEVTISADGTYALVGDYDNHLIRRIDMTTAFVSTLAGTSGSSGSTNGVGTISQFNNPVGVAISADGTSALVADFRNHLIRRINITTASVSTLAGTSGSTGSTNGVGTISQFYYPTGVAISADGTYALVTDQYNNLIRRIIITTASVSTFAGSGSPGSTNGVGTISQFNRPFGLAISADGTSALVVDWGYHVIRRINMTTAFVSTLAGSGSPGSTNGVGTSSQFNHPYGVAISADGTYALVADHDNHLIRRIDMTTASVSTLAGTSGSSGSTNGVGTISRFNGPAGVAISADGTSALVADRGNHLIRRIGASVSPSSDPSLSPTSLPSIPRPTLFGFGVKIGDEAILSSGKAILVDYLRDAKRGEIFLPIPSLLSFGPHSLSLPYSLLSVSGKMLPISGIVDSSQVSSASDPPLSSDSILIKWRPVSAVSGIGSWEPSSHTLLSIPAGGVLVSWLVSLLSEEIKGFIIKGE
jgi:DNA-binding beta-propeller fold protein YncE